MAIPTLIVLALAVFTIVAFTGSVLTFTTATATACIGLVGAPITLGLAGVSTLGTLLTGVFNFLYANTT